MVGKYDKTNKNVCHSIPNTTTIMSESNIDVNALGEKIVRVLKTIFDPEIPVDIYELGLIYDVFVNEDYEVKISDDAYHTQLPSCRNTSLRS